MFGPKQLAQSMLMKMTKAEHIFAKSSAKLSIRVRECVGVQVSWKLGRQTEPLEFHLTDKHGNGVKAAVAAEWAAQSGSGSAPPISAVLIHRSSEGYKLYESGAVAELKGRALSRSSISLSTLSPSGDVLVAISGLAVRGGPCTGGGGAGGSSASLDLVFRAAGGPVACVVGLAVLPGEPHEVRRALGSAQGHVAVLDGESLHKLSFSVHDEAGRVIPTPRRRVELSYPSKPIFGKRGGGGGGGRSRKAEQEVVRGVATFKGTTLHVDGDDTFVCEASCGGAKAATVTLRGSLPRDPTRMSVFYGTELAQIDPSKPIEVRHVRLSLRSSLCPALKQCPVRSPLCSPLSAPRLKQFPVRSPLYYPLFAPL